MRTDRTKGRQIINHITVKNSASLSISSIIAAHCTHAVGAAYALERRGERGRAIFCQFGEGATSEGEWHEAINFAAVHNLPVVFICENNRWAISTPQDKQMANPDVAARASGYGMASAIVDGFDPRCGVRDGTRRTRPAQHPAPARRSWRPSVIAFSRTRPTMTIAPIARAKKSTPNRALDPVPRFEKRLIDAGF